jgi:uncharacterized protein YaiL (DUF2058 family)
MIFFFSNFQPIKQSSNLENNLTSRSRSPRKEGKKKSQLKQLIDKNSVRVVIVDDNAYWVNNNSIYRAKVDEIGRIDVENANQIDVFSLSERETKSLLKIIDSISD